MDDDDDDDVPAPNVGNLGKSTTSGGKNLELSIPNNSMGWIDTESKIKPIRLMAGCRGTHARVCTVARINVLGGVGRMEDGRKDTNKDWKRGIKSIMFVTVVRDVPIFVLSSSSSSSSLEYT